MLSLVISDGFGIFDDMLTWSSCPTGRAKMCWREKWNKVLHGKHVTDPRDVRRASRPDLLIDTETIKKVKYKADRLENRWMSSKKQGATAWSADAEWRRNRLMPKRKAGIGCGADSMTCGACGPWDPKHHMMTLGTDLDRLYDRRDVNKPWQPMRSDLEWGKLMIKAKTTRIKEKACYPSWYR